MQVLQEGTEGAIILACIASRILRIKHTRKGFCNVEELLPGPGTS